MRFQRHGLSSPIPTCSKAYRRRHPEGPCADTATVASPASAENRSTATTTRSAPKGTSCFVVLEEFDEHARRNDLCSLSAPPEGRSAARRCVRVLGGTAR